MLNEYEIKLNSFAKIRKSSSKKEKRWRLFLRLLGDPQQKFRSIHVAGTSGKGSTAAFISSILSQAGYRVGLNISPHVLRVNERIQLHNKEIDDSTFSRYLDEIFSLTKEVEKEASALSYFEVVTGLAFYIFAREKVDIAVVEAGIGGTRDVTNILIPEISVLTNVDLDHTRVLGNTVEKIATDKCGIIKPGVSVVSGVRQPSVIEVVKTRADQQNSSLFLLDRDFGLENRYVLALRGKHQVENASLALQTIHLLSEKGWNIPIEAIEKGLASAYLPGRFEIIQRNPTLILDGAHNVAKIKAVINTIKDQYPNRKVTLVFTPKKDKDTVAMLVELAPITEKVVLTQLEGIPVPSLIERTSKFIRETLKLPVEFYHTSSEVIEQISRFPSDSIVLVTGSFYLVGEITNSLRKNS